MAHEMGEGQFWVWAPDGPARITRLTNDGTYSRGRTNFPLPRARAEGWGRRNPLDHTFPVGSTWVPRFWNVPRAEKPRT